MDNHIQSIQIDLEGKVSEEELIKARKDNVKLILQATKKYIQKDFNLIDIGSGDGNLSKYICDELSISNYKFYDIVKPEQNKQSISAMLLNHNESQEINIYNGQNIPEPDNSYNIISCIFVLHHTGMNQIQIIKEMIRVSKSYIIILEDLNESQFKERNKLHDKNGIFRTNKEWNDLWIKYNLTILEQGYCHDKDKPQYYYLLKI